MTDTIRKVTSRVAISAMELFDPRLNEVPAEHVQVVELANGYLSPITTLEYWSLSAWPNRSFTEHKACEASWICTIRSDFMRSFMKHMNDMDCLIPQAGETISKRNLHLALVLARAELALAIHLLGTKNLDSKALRDFQDTLVGDDKESLRRPEDTAAFKDCIS